MDCSPWQIVLLPLLLCLACISAQSVAADKAPCNFPAIFNYGDSNSDTGDLSAVFGQAAAPAGETYFGKPSGRYTDGRLIVDFIVEKSNIVINKGQGCRLRLFRGKTRAVVLRSFRGSVPFREWHSRLCTALVQT